MDNNFLDREWELKFLEERFRQNRAELILLYGRRRIGKTFLVKKFLENKKGIYFMATKEDEKTQAKTLSLILSKIFNDKLLEMNPLTNFSQIFEYLAEKAKDERIVFVIDEFGYLMEAFPPITSVLQKYWDEKFSSSKLFIILSGSQIGMMESLMSIKNPLYGRRTGQIKLNEFEFKVLRELLSEKSFEDVLKCWFVTDGILFYAKEFKNYETFEKFLLNTFFRKGHIFSEEGRFLISEELGDTITYFSILLSIASGHKKLVEIANEIGMKATSLTPYLTKLINLNFVRKEFLVTEKEKTRKIFYEINDNFLRFWFRFVYPNRSLIEMEDYQEIKKILEKELNSFFGEMFEEFVRKNVEKFLPFKVNKKGRWWGYVKEGNERKREEIDVVCLNEESREIAFVEVKWSEKISSEKVLNELKRKAELVDWNKGKRKEYFFIFGKSFDKKVEEHDIYTVDLKDLEKTLTQNFSDY